MEKPQECYLTTVKRVLRYIKVTINHGVMMPKQNKTNTYAKVYGYTNSNFSEDHDEKKSIAGYIFMIEGAPISWSQESKTLWLCHLVKLSMWLHHMQHVKQHG